MLSRTANGPVSNQNRRWVITVSLWWLACMICQVSVFAQGTVRYADVVVDGTESGGAPGMFGWSVALDGEWAVVADRQEGAPLIGIGAISMYRRTANGYEFYERIIPPLAAPGTGVEYESVDIHGNVLVFTREQRFLPATGEVIPRQPYLFRFDGTSWAFEALLRPIPSPTGTNASALFGASNCLIREDLVVVTSVLRRNGPSLRSWTAMHFYEFDGSNWSDSQLWLDLAHNQQVDHLVGHMDSDGTSLAVTSRTGHRIAVLDRDSQGNWYRSANFINPRVWDMEDLLYSPVAIEGDLLAIGQPMYRTTVLPYPPHWGTVQVMRKSGGAWVLEGELEASDSWFGQQGSTGGTYLSDSFGYSVDISDGRILVGAPNAHIFPGQQGEYDTYGSAYLFEQVGGQWEEVYKLWSHNPMRRDGMGHQVALDGELALVGASAVAISGNLLSEEGHIFYLPMGNTVCLGMPNSTNLGAKLEVQGFRRVSDGFLKLRAKNVPTGSVGYFLASPVQGFTAHPGGSAGNLCLGSPVARFSAANQTGMSGAQGELELSLDPSDVPLNRTRAIMPGETWYFQAWYRDSGAAGVSNFTDAVGVTFE